jgi:hypothetical protein
MAEPITQFPLDPERLAVIRECMERYDVGGREAEWPNNIISRRALVYGSGLIAREGDTVRCAIDPGELALCQRLAGEAERLMSGTEVGMGSESGDEFRAFFITANVGDAAPSSIDESLIRARFGSTIFPPATITVEPIAEAGIWWSEVLRDGEESEPESFAPWRAMIRWFRDRRELRTAAFIRIGDRRILSRLRRDDLPPGTEMPGCVLPRLALGLTKQGSLVGLFGHSVQT